MTRYWLIAALAFAIGTTIATRSVDADPSVAKAADPEEAGFQPLFNGKDLEGWLGATNRFAVEDGALVCLAGHSRNLYTKDQFGDFILRFEFQLTPGGNNGVALRSPTNGIAALDGMEIQVLDDTARQYGKLKPYQYHGSIYGVAPAKRGHLKPVGEWNRQEIRCTDRTITIVLNGTTVLHANLDQVAPSGKGIDGRAHPGLARSEGHIGLLGHDSRVAFRNLRIRPIPPKKSP